jgi:replicative DNA helicase
MGNRKNVLETSTLLKSISKKGAVVLNMYNDRYRKFLTNVLILESLNIKNKAVLVFTLNQAKEDLIHNLLSTKAGVSTLKRNLQDYDWVKIAEATEKFKDISIGITDECVTVDDIVITISNYIENNSEELIFVLIDNLEKIESETSIDMIVKDLNIFAIKNKLSIIILK